MCINIVAIGKNREEIKDVIEETFIANKKANDDGFFVGDIAGGKIIRTLDEKEALKTIKSLNSTYVHMHMRAATSGKVDVANVHGWHFDKYLVSHNGYYGDRVYSKVDDNSDSFNMFSAIDYSSVEAIIQSINKMKDDIYGVLFFTSPSIIIMAGIDKAVRIYKTENNLYLANTDIDLTESFFGLTFDVYNTSFIDGVLVFAIDGEDIKLVRKEKINVDKKYGRYKYFGYNRADEYDEDYFYDELSDRYILDKYRVNRL